MIPLPLGRIAEITSGALMGMADPSTIVRGPVVIDSRAAEPGSLFVAIKGQRVDGHDFAPAAVAAGATAVLAARPTEAPTVIVSDVVAALADLAREVCAKLPSATVIGVTGSAGKTTTKDLLARLTARMGPTVAPVGSYNNEIGHPLTVLRADETTRFLVLELSAREVGHIAHLARIAPPRIGVVLNVAAPTWACSAGARRSPRPRESSSRRCRETASPCSTPTIPTYAPWPSAPTPG